MNEIPFAAQVNQISNGFLVQFPGKVNQIQQRQEPPKIIYAKDADAVVEALRSELPVEGN